MTTNEDFWRWVDQEMNERGLSFYQLERSAGVGNATVSRPAREWREPTLMVCRVIARGLGVSLEDVLRKAGILPNRPADDSIDRQAAWIIGKFYEGLFDLPSETQRQIADQILFLVNAHRAAVGLTEPVPEAGRGKGEKTKADGR